MAATNNDSPTLGLLHSAFGPQSTLYTVLGCTKSASSAELKRAYRKAALKHHPDRCNESSTSSAEESTLKFQAVSAAYQVLMDAKRRSVYDRTDQILEEQDDIGCRDDGGCTYTSSNSPKASRRSTSKNQWEQFFQSIFNEIISTGSNHAASASSYRGSTEETQDVLHYYKMCKGDLNKVAECIIHGSSKDIVRWERDIVIPAVKRGEVDGYKGVNDDTSSGMSTNKKKERRMILEDSSSSEDEEVVKVSSNSKRRLGGKNKRNNNSLLVDTDDEVDNDSTPQKHRISISESSNASSSMNKRDKMNFRVAKKRKAKAAKEMEMADIMQSKNWSMSDASSRQRSKKKNMGGISDAFLSNVEKKYGGNDKKRRNR